MTSTNFFPPYVTRMNISNNNYLDNLTNMLNHEQDQDLPNQWNHLLFQVIYEDIDYSTWITIQNTYIS